MAIRSQKSKDKNAEILHVIGKYAQILRSRRKGVEMLHNGHINNLTIMFFYNMYIWDKLEHYKYNSK